jgi:hypothetical protein
MCSFEMFGTAHPLTMCHIPEDWNPSFALKEGSRFFQNTLIHLPYHTSVASHRTVMLISNNIQISIPHVKENSGKCQTISVGRTELFL